MADTFTSEELKKALEELDAWQLKNNKLHKIFVFKNFVETFAFMTSVALIAEKMNHHPDWSNLYNTLSIDLSTDDSNGITHLDIELATKIDQLR